MTSLDSVALLAPEIALVAAALVAYLGGAFLGLRHGWLVALAGILAAMSLAGGQPADGASVTSGPVTVDAFSTFVRWVVLGAGALLALVQSGDVFTAATSRGPGLHRGGTCEEAGTFLVMLAGLSLVGVADDLVLLFAGLELVSIPTYVLLGLKRTDDRGREAAIKYFFLSLIASAVFLYGAATLYGIRSSQRATPKSWAIEVTAVAKISRNMWSSAWPMFSRSRVGRLCMVLCCPRMSWLVHRQMP